MTISDASVATAVIPDSAVIRVEPLPKIETIAGEPEFRFFVAGASGSGKTVFLASLNNQLGSGDRKVPFYVEIDDERQRAILTKNFNQIRDPGQSWPGGDVDVTNYVLRCLSLRGKLPLFRFHYTDFPGGFMTNPSPDQALDFSVAEAVKIAHTVVFLIDGRKILDALEGRKIKGFSIWDDLESISWYATRSLSRPTQFVITKWDIFGGLKIMPETLGRIRRFLLKNDRFRNLVEIRRFEQMPTYLVPVSSVGDEFVRYDSSTGEMVKQRTEQGPRPYNLDITLALAVTDTLLSSFKRAPSRRDLAWITVLKSFIGSVGALRWIAGAYLATITDNGLVAAMMIAASKATERLPSVAAGIQQQIEAKMSQVGDKNIAIETITEIQRLKVAQFLAECPAADLLSTKEDSD